MRTAAEFGLAEQLHSQPTTAQAFAEAQRLDPDATARFLRTCASLGLATMDEDGRFAGTPLLDLLRKDHPQSLRGLALSQAAPGHWNSWAYLPEAIRSGEAQAARALGADFFDYLRGQPAEAEAFTQAMSGLTAAVSAEVARLLDTADVHNAVDVGGAGGALLIGLLEANPSLRGIVFDLPDVVPDAIPLANRSGVGDRMTTVGGDFFKEMPQGDLYLLKYILHDWNDAECLEILRNCRSAAQPGARIAVVELLVGPVGEPGLAPLMDMNMLVMMTGRERTL